ncbi:MAG: TIR domain-containing protein [Bacteroidota bacterium]
MSSKPQNRIFLCHASEDKPQVMKYYHQLKAADFNPWMDKMDLLPGQNWRREIPKAIQSARFIIVFFSQHSVSKRGYVQREFKLALDTLEEIPYEQIYVIPVRLEVCDIPPSFGDIHYVDLFEKGGFDFVIKAIGMEVGGTSQVVTTANSSNLFTDTHDEQVYKTVELMGKGCWFYNGDPKNGEKYGRLYTWDAAKRACPRGWRLPSKEKIDALVDHFGSKKATYEALIDGGESGINALLGDWRNFGISFNYLGSYGFYLV